MRFLAGILLATAVVAPVARADFDTAYRAYAEGDYATALGEFEELAEGGHARSQYLLGVMYAGAEGVRRDLRKAAELYRLAANQGLPEAQTALAFVYRVGNGVSRNDAEAVKWYRLAAEGGVGDAQFNLASLYAVGKGTERDVVQAYRWFSIAVANGVDEARPALYYCADQMTRAQIAEAQALAAAWRPRD